MFKLFSSSSLVLILSSGLVATQATADSPEKPAFDYDAYTLSVEQTQSRQMAAFIARSENFNQLVTKSCQSGAQNLSQPMKDWNALPKLQQAWLNTSEEWQRLQVFPLGPNTDVTVRLNISFWPDKKNLVERKARTLLNQGENAELKQGGIAIQGLTASEYLLFDPNHLKKSSPQQSCHLLSQIAAQSEANAKAMLTRWNESDFLVEWHDAALGNETFASTTQAVGYLLSGLAEQLEAIAKYKLEKPFRLNDENAKANGYLAENWRSNQSLTNLATNFSQLKAYYLGLKSDDSDTMVTRAINGPDQLLRHLGYFEEADQIVAQLNQSQGTLNTLVNMGSAAYLSKEGKAQAEQLHKNIKQLERALKKPLPHFQLTQRFNSADGD